MMQPQRSIPTRAKWHFLINQGKTNSSRSSELSVIQAVELSSLRLKQLHFQTSLRPGLERACPLRIQQVQSADKY